MTSGERERERVSSQGWGVHGEGINRQIQSDDSSPTQQTHIFFFWGDTHPLEQFTQPANMMHPLIIGIMTVNTSLTVVYWTFILGDAYYKWMMEPEDKPKKIVTPAWGEAQSIWTNFCLELVRKSSPAYSAFLWRLYEWAAFLFHLEKTWKPPPFLLTSKSYWAEWILQVNEKGVIHTATGKVQDLSQVTTLLGTHVASRIIQSNTAATNDNFHFVFQCFVH